MKHFGEVLLTLGGTDIKLLEETADWDFWSTAYRTPAGDVAAHYRLLRILYERPCPIWPLTESGKD